MKLSCTVVSIAAAMYFSCRPSCTSLSGIFRKPDLRVYVLFLYPLATKTFVKARAYLVSVEYLVFVESLVFEESALVVMVPKSQDPWL